MMVNKLIYIIPVICLMMSCSRQVDSKAHSSRVSQSAGDYEFSLISIESDTSDTDQLEFVLNLKRKDGEDLVAFDGVKSLIQSRIYYYSYRIKEAIYLEQDDYILPVDFCHFERSFDLKKGRNFMLAFDKSLISQTKPYQVIIDSEVLATGPVKFSITPN